MLHPLDAAWLYVDSHDTPMQVAALHVFSPPPRAPEDYLGRMVAEFKAVRRLAAPWNKKLAGGLLGRLLPAWIEDQGIDLDYHVRHSALPRPGGERDLGILVSRLHSYPLDFTRPLWECHFIEGLQGNRFAVYFKMHHSLIDGVSGMRLLQKMLSTDRHARNMPAPWAGAPQDHPRRAGRAAESGPTTDPLGAAAAFIADQLESLGHVGPALGEIVSARWREGDTLVGPFCAPASILNGRITAQRRFATRSFALDDLRRLAKAAEATLNDIVLAICAGALRRFLLEAGTLPLEPLTAGLPVNVRAEDDTETGTAITFICANLATNVEDPRHRLEAITASTRRAKAHLQALPQAALTQYTMAFMAPYIVQLLTGLGGRLPSVFNLTISNVPGPDEPLYLNGARLEAMYPMSLLSHGQALNITCLSYAGALHFGFTGCRDTLPHMQRLAVYAGDAMAELQAAWLTSATSASRSRATSRSTTRGTRRGRPARRP